MSADSYAEQIKALVSAYETVVIGDKAHYRPQDVKEITKLFNSELNKIYRHTEQYYKDVDFSYFTTDQLQEIKTDYSAWENWIKTDADKSLAPYTIVKRIDEELATRTNPTT